MQQRYDQFLKKNTSIYIKNILRDNENIFVGILGMLLSVVGELIYMLVIIIFSLSLISLIITYDEIFLVLVVLFLIIFLLKLSSKYGVVRSNNETSAFKLLNESFLIFKEIKLSGKAQQFVEKFDRYINRYYTSKAIHGVINISPKIIFEFGLLIFFYLNFLNSGLNVADYISKFAVLVLIALRILPSFSKVSSNLAGVFYNLESLKLIYSDLNKKNLSSAFVINAKTKSQLVLKNINLKKISHKFTNEDKTIHILKDFNYEFKIGKMYGIYGKSGLGKSTLLEIISGLIIPEKGKVYANTKKKRFLELYKTFNLSFLSQNPKIMDDNLISNLTLNFNHRKKDLEKIIFLLKKFNLNKFANLSFLSEKSPLSIKKLSGGEIQRISFIRSIFYDSDILLLDEPTAALDQANERILFSYLQSIKKDKIIIVTSHKNQLIKYFDKVINLEKVNAK